MFYRTHVLAPILATVFFLLFVMLTFTGGAEGYLNGLSAGLMLISSAAALLIGFFTAMATHHERYKKVIYLAGVVLFFVGLLFMMIMTAPNSVNILGFTLLIGGLVVSLIGAWTMRHHH